MLTDASQPMLIVAEVIEEALSGLCYHLCGFSFVSLLNACLDLL